MVTWRDIPGFFDFESVYDNAVADAPDGSALVEVGCLFGKSTVYMAERIKESGKALKFYAVDRWDMWMDSCGELIFTDPWFIDYMNLYGGMFEAFYHNIVACGVHKLVSVMKMNSSDAARRLCGKNVHFVFIDADHNYEAVKSDLDEWLKVTPRLAGHDYDWPGVRQAVDETFKGKIQLAGTSWIAQ